MSVDRIISCPKCMGKGIISKMATKGMEIYFCHQCEGSGKVRVKDIYSIVKEDTKSFMLERNK